MATPRLPVPGDDSGNWGEILNSYLLVAHNNDGSLKAESVILNKANKTYVDTELAAKANKNDLSDVATSGSFNDLTDIPAAQDLSNLVTLSGVQTITGNKDFTGGLKTEGNIVVGTNDVRLSDTRIPTNDSVATSKLQDGSVTEPKLAVSNNPASGNFLSWNGSALTWQDQAGAVVSSVNGHVGDVTVTKADVGLGNAQDTSDANKPISIATQTALDLKANTSSLSTVATTGSYADLTNKPTIPSAGTSSSTYAAGDDSRITGALQKSVATTKGDIFVATANAAVGRLGVGANNQVLTADSTQANGVKWADVASGSTGIVRSVHIITANETAASALKTDYIYVFSNPATLTLPTVTGSGNAYTIKNFSGASATVVASGSDVIDGETQMVLQHTQSYTLYDVGSSAWIVT